MSQIPPHFWLEVLPAGLQVQQTRSLRMEDRELLAAIGSAPSRVLDVFRRLRWTDSQAFQDSLSHMVMRQWVVAREQQFDASLKEGAGASSEEHADPLMALLARHAQQTPDLWGPDLDTPLEPEAGESEQEEASVQDEGDDTDSTPSQASQEEEEGSERASLEVEEGGQEWSDDAPEPSEDAPPSLAPMGNEGTEDLLSAMGINAPVDLLRPSAPSKDIQDKPVSKSTPDPAPSSPSHDALLKALLRGDPAPAAKPVVEVPEYGLPTPASQDDLQGEEGDGFVRLRDMQPSIPSEKDPKSEPPRPMTEAERRRQQMRQQMLEAARREQAQRQAARDRALALEAQKQAEAEKREERRKVHRAIEATQKANTFLSRAERARRIRDGLPLDSDKDAKD